MPNVDRSVRLLALDFAGFRWIRNLSYHALGYTFLVSGSYLDEASICLYFLSREQGWFSNESACLLLQWPMFDSQTWCHMWVEFVGGSCPGSKGFLGLLQVTSLHKNQHSKFQSNLEPVDKKVAQMLTQV